MDLRRLSHFIALAEEGRFAPAAERVHLSPAAFSRSIQALEAQLGLRLLDRGPQGIALTQAGELVLRRARELVFASGCLERDIDLMKSGDAGELVLGAAPVPAATIVPALLSELRQQSPHLVTRLRFGSLPQLLAQLEAQEIDVCLGDPRLMARNEHYEMMTIGRQFGGLYCRRGHPLARKGVADAEALTRYGVALISMTPTLLDTLAAACGLPSEQRFPLALEGDDIPLLARQVADSDLLGILPHAVAASSAFKLRPLHTANTIPAFAHVHAIWLRQRTLSPAAARAVRLARAIGERLERDFTDG